MTPALRILEPGLAATVQDCGRPGYQRFGVPVSGALDAVSLQIANVLAGNPPCSAAIEILGAGLALEVEAESVALALAGTAASLTVQTGKAAVCVPPFRSAIVQRAGIVRIPPPKGGAVCYLAVGGGFDIPPVLGSQSTYRRAALGGFHGRALRAGDRLPLRLASSRRAPVFLDADIRAPEVLRVMRGPNADYFSASAFETLFASAYTVSAASDRMGLRLQGPRLERAIEGELPSQGTAAGGMQVPADGQPILLLADRQTTGGYPRIATVTGADIAAAGRLAAGMSVRFGEVSREDAVRLLKARQSWLASLPALLKPAPADALSAEGLLSRNLIGGVTAGSPEESGA
ncbi:MAG: biotin-dependent carboxyltransferase family protein [Rhodomicrobium sp.]|nr:biotin-dependent carboxyltransferase family protein [Rhodomicrobium sp.]